MIAMNLFLAFCFNVVWQKLSGPLLLTVLGLPIFLELLTSAGLGVKNGYLLVRNNMLLVLLPSAGLSGKYSNSVCFEGKVVTSTITIICYACSLMNYWAGLVHG